MSTLRRTRVSASTCAAVARIELQLDRIDDDVGARELAHLRELHGRKRGLSRPAPSERHDVRDPRVRDRVDCLVRGVGRSELLRRQREHARHVERDVPVTDHDRALDVEVERETLKVRMAVVPGHELERRPRAWEILAGNPELPIGLRTDRVDHGVVQPREFVVVQVAPDLDVSEEAEAGLRGDALESARDRLELRVVGRNAEADEPPRRREALDHVDLDGNIRVEERAGGVEARRSRADYGEAERS